MFLLASSPSFAIIVLPSELLIERFCSEDSVKTSSIVDNSISMFLVSAFLADVSAEIERVAASSTASEGLLVSNE